MEIDIGFKSGQLEKTYSVLRNSIKKVDENIQGSLHDTAVNIVDEARSNLQNNTSINTGSLLASIDIIEETDKSVVVGSELEYAGWIEYGRGPVDPINAKMLHWIDKTTGKDVFARHANATEPRPFLEPAVISKTKDFPGIIATRQQEVIDES